MIKRYKRRHGTGEQREEQAYRLPDPMNTAPLMANKYVPLGQLGSDQSHELVPQPKPELSADTIARAELEGHREGVTK